MPECAPGAQRCFNYRNVNYMQNNEQTEYKTVRGLTRGLSY